MAVSENRLVHLDLKGAPLKVDYLEKLFPVLAEWGATGLLLEWEDTFPYRDRLSGIGSRSAPSLAYSEADVRHVLALAAENNLCVMPLVQTFGHLEFVLKRPEFRSLREVERFPASLCPSHASALTLVTDMLDQVLAASPDATHVHIGADEVWHLGVCERCRGQPRARVFLAHVCAVLHHLRHRHPRVQPVMWDDMLRDIDQPLLNEFKIGELVEPMVWHYQAAHAFTLSDQMWEKYSRVFPRVWLASAFKGATGSCQLLPVTLHHVSNHQQWLGVTQSLADRFQHVCGIALTGWSRYDHYAALCELLPPSLPSLALCLRVWLSRGFDDKLLHSVSQQLGYTDSPLPLNPYPRPQSVPQQLLFPGWRLAAAVEWLANLRAKQAAVLDSDQIQTWLNPWQIDNNFTNPMQIESLDAAFKELQQEWASLERCLHEHLPEVYYERTVEEWLCSTVVPHVRRLHDIAAAAARQLSHSTE